MKATIVWTVIVLASVAVCAQEQAPAGETPDPKEILQKADTAIKKIDAVRFSAVSIPTGVALNFAAAAEGEAVLVGWNQEWGMPEKFYVHVETTRQGKEQELTGGGNGETFFLIDHTSKKGYEDMDPAVMGSSTGTLQRFGMQEYVHVAPFDDELKAEKIEYQGTEEVGGVLCHKVFVEYAGGQGKSTWFFGTSDYLPRRRVLLFSLGDQGEGSVTIEIKKLEIDPKVDPSLFTMNLPEGYERVDDFAP
jgi:outer membrane lipoprotein-sorting protein